MLTYFLFKTSTGIFGSSKRVFHMHSCNIHMYSGNLVVFQYFGKSCDPKVDKYITEIIVFKVQRAITPKVS